MSVIDVAESTFRQGYSCSQAVFSAFSEELGLPRDTAYRVAGGFGGGMGRLGGTCGAVTGALMALGMKYRGATAGDVAAKEKTYERVRAFVKAFREINGSDACRELLGCDIGTPRGMAHAQENNLFKTSCVKYVRDAADILEKMLRE